MEAIKTDWRQAEVDERMKAMLAYSEKLTRTPGEAKEADLEGLRGHGLSDEQILAVVLIASFFNVATRVADALGVELDPQFHRGTPEYEKFMQG
ncbi:MAG: hypothetical protein V3R29_02505 [Candidatus Acidoferrales bacterium]